MELSALKVALEKEGLIAEIHNNAVEVFRNWSYESGANRSTDWYVPADEYVEAYSDTLYITFTGSAFIAAEESGKAIAREEVIAEYDPEAGITETDIIWAADSLAETISYMLPEREAA